jgi:hypothetical protein
MTYTIRVSSSYVVDLDNAESPLDGFVRKDKWPVGRHSCSVPMVRLEAPNSSELSADFEAVLLDQLRVMTEHEGVTAYRHEDKGRLSMLVTFSPGTGAVRLPAAFMGPWAALGGYVDLDTPLD